MMSEINGPVKDMAPRRPERRPSPVTEVERYQCIYNDLLLQ